VVRDQLEKKAIPAFLPTIPKWSRWKDRKKKIDWPLFPGYCFARFDPMATRIRLLIGSEMQFDPCPLIHEGMMVEVVHGPLRGVIGRLVRKDANRAQLVLSVDLIGQAVSVVVEAADVRAY
jgi:transcription antitermination factor NusG